MPSAQQSKGVTNLLTNRSPEGAGGLMGFAQTPGFVLVLFLVFVRRGEPKPTLHFIAPSNKSEICKHKRRFFSLFRL